MPPLGRYGQSIAELLMRQGDAQAQGHLRGGAIASNFVGELGNAVIGGVQDWEYGKEQQRQESNNQEVADLMSSDIWETDPEWALGEIIRLKGPDAGMKLAEGLKTYMETESTSADAQAFRTQALKNLPVMVQGLLAAGPGARERLYPGVVDQLERAAVVRPGELPREWVETPENVGFLKEMLNGYVEQGENKVMSPNSSLMSPEGDVIATAPAAPAAPEIPFEEELRRKKALAQATAEGRAAGTPQTAASQATEAKDETAWGIATTDAERKRISSSRYALRKVPTMEKFLKENSNVIGPIQGRLTKLRQKWGGGADFEIGKREAELAVLRNAIVNALSGVAVNPQEFERIKEQIPNITDTEAVFKAKLAVLEEYFTEVLNEFRAPLSGSGPTSSAAPAVGPKTIHFDAQGNMVQPGE